jgi:hypothetical protein
MQFGEPNSYIPACPVTLDEWEKVRHLPGIEGWKDPQWVTNKFHPGATVTVRLVFTGHPSGELI